MAFTTIDNPELYFQTKLYTGTGSSHAITLDGSENMQPDWVWIKRRNSAGGHMLTDVIRGVTKTIITNETGAEQTFSNGLTAFGSDGFTVGSEDGFNASSDTFVAWNWKAGTSFSNDASSTGVGSLDSSGSKNTTAGFSIISFTGTESGTPSIAHGLSSTPEFIISKARDVSDNWMVFHGSFSAQEYISLNSTGAKASASSVWNSLPSSTVINMGDNAGVNDDGAMIMYAFNSVKGFSKFGSYTGNGNADGTFVYTGFKPAFVIIKPSSYSNSWLILDNKRNTFNPTNTRLEADGNGADYSGLDYTDFLSNGFKIRTSNSHPNDSGGTLIYIAFAESPFTNSSGVPNNAR
mgnify:CR=1 FL=1|jgi:hypothetical protein